MVIVYTLSLETSDKSESLSSSKIYVWPTIKNNNSLLKTQTTIVYMKMCTEKLAQNIGVFSIKLFVFCRSARSADKSTS